MRDLRGFMGWALVALAGTFPAMACSSSSDGDSGGGICGKVCACVVKQLGSSAQSQCMSECQSSLKSANPRSECETRLDANGAGTCKYLCASAPSGSGGSSG